MEAVIIDAHAHCGRQFREPPQDLQDYRAGAEGTGIGAVVMFPPVMEIYDRHDRDFQDNEYWRQRRKEANEYLVSIGDAELEVIPFFFIWNDFCVDQLSPQHRGIKWHRHGDEPTYHYDDPKCRAAIEEIGRRNLPVTLEEELENTMRFIDDLAPGLRVIIPHCGNLNGGYEALCRLGVWARPNIFTDTSCSPTREEMRHYVDHYGHERILFGSDFPFGHPRHDLEKVMDCGFPDRVTEAIVGGNARRLLAQNVS